jgi:hypothetical protein
MQKQINSVKEFHKAFKIGHSEIQLPRWEIARIRWYLMKENEKYLEAVQNDNLIEIDALGDMMYILCGTN